MDDQAARVTEVRDMAEQVQAANELRAGFIAAFQLDREQGASPFRADFRDAILVGGGLKPGIGDTSNRIMTFQPRGNFLGVCNVFLHPHGERLDAHQRIMRRLRVERHTEVAQADGNAVEGERGGAECLVEIQAVIGRFRLRQGRELVRRRPVELAGIDNCAAGDRAIAGHVFR